jgi:heterogeneous nuclear ribonucleoprotein F/H
MGGGGGMGGMRGGGGMGMGGGGMGGMFIVKMRGLPFRATEQDICEWFSSVADPVDVLIRFNGEGRPSGEAEVSFASEGEAKRALSKNKQNMQNRYIELFLEQGY